SSLPTSGETGTVVDAAPTGSSDVAELSLRDPPQEEAVLAVAVETEIADCMAAEGFAYYYLPASEFVVGLTHRNASASLSFPLGDPNEGDETIGPPLSVADPNGELLESMDDAGRS